MSETFRVEWLNGSGEWLTWGEANTEDEGASYLAASRRANSELTFRLVEVVTTEVVRDA